MRYEDADTRVGVTVDVKIVQSMSVAKWRLLRWTIRVTREDIKRN